MLGSVYRLRNRRTFGLIHKRGRRRSGSLLMVAWIEKQEGISTRSGGLRQTRPQQGNALAPQATDPWIKTQGEIFQVTVSQIAVVVSRKVSRKAVERNRIKRRIRAALVMLLPRIRGDHWIAIYARSGALGCGWEQLIQELSFLLSKAGLLDPICSPNPAAK